MRVDREQAQQLIRSHPDYLRDGGALNVAASTSRADVVELLLDLGMDAEIEDGQGVRALHWAAWRGAMDVVQVLIRRGADVNARERKYGGTPLSWAIHGRQPQMVDFLAELSGDVFALTYAGRIEQLRTVLASEPQLALDVRDGITPLFGLPDDEDRAFEIAQLLLACGADARVRSAAGVSAAEEAEKRGLDAAAELLRSAETGAGGPR
jgi:ankyrin repeat protein